MEATAPHWRKRLQNDPIPPLLSAGDETLEYFVRRDLLGEPVPPARCLWGVPGARKILEKQLPDGS